MERMSRPSASPARIGPQPASNAYNVRYRSPKKGYIHLSRAYRRVSIVVCSRGLRLRLARDWSQISPCSLKVMFEVLSRKVCMELMPSFSRFSAAFRSAIVRVRQTPNETKSRSSSACPGTSRQNCTYADSVGSHGSLFFRPFWKTRPCCHLRLIRDLPLRRGATISGSVAESGNVHLALFDGTDVPSNASALCLTRGSERNDLRPPAEIEQLSASS